MRATSFQLSFKDLNTPSALERDVAVEFLPCQFQSNIDECNKEVYFDPIVRPHTLPSSASFDTTLQRKKNLMTIILVVKEVSL